MAKKKDEELVSLGEALLVALDNYIAGTAGSSGKASSKEEEEGFEWPELTEINSMKLPALVELGETIQLDLDGSKLSEARTLMVTARSIALNEDVDDLDEDDVTALAEKLDITPSKKIAKTVEAIAEYFSDDKEESSEKESDDDDDDKPKKKKKVVEESSDDDDDDDDKKKKKKKESDEGDDSDGVDREQIAEDADEDEFPDEDEMRERIEAYNEAQDDEDKQIELPKKGGKALVEAYRSLVKELVDSNEKIAEWGEAYARDDQAFCCGLPLVEVEVKGHEECGKCQVTGKIFEADSEGDLVEVKVKGKK